LTWTKSAHTATDAAADAAADAATTQPASTAAGHQQQQQQGQECSSSACSDRCSGSGSSSGSSSHSCGQHPPAAVVAHVQQLAGPQYSLVSADLRDMQQLRAALARAGFKPG
jgi:hypothetical protein